VEEARRATSAHAGDCRWDGDTVSGVARNAALHSGRRPAPVCVCVLGGRFSSNLVHEGKASFRGEGREEGARRLTNQR
jgi:hypothetical protein